MDCAQLHDILANVASVRLAWDSKDLDVMRERLGSEFTYAGRMMRKMIPSFLWRSLDVSLARRMMADPVLLGHALLWIHCPVVDRPLAILHMTLFDHSWQTRLINDIIESAPCCSDEGAVFVGFIIESSDGDIVSAELESIGWNPDDGVQTMREKRRRFTNAIECISIVVRMTVHHPQVIGDLQVIAGKFKGGAFFTAVFACEDDIDCDVVPPECTETACAYTYGQVTLFQDVARLFEQHELLCCHAASMVRLSPLYRFFTASMKAWRRAISDPAYGLCQHRLMKEVAQFRIG